LETSGRPIAIVSFRADARSAEHPLPSFFSRLAPDGAVSVVVLRSFAMGVPASPSVSPK